MPSFGNVLKQKLEERIFKVLGEVGAGVPLDKYPEMVGYLRGLEDAVKYCQEIEKDME